MIAVQQIQDTLVSKGLHLNGIVQAEASDDVPQDCQTLLMIGPNEPQFWSIFSSSSEYSDGAKHPLDRWSKRVIGELSRELGGAAFFPYDGPPYWPFLRWAERTERAWPSPTGLLVHYTAGLFLSYRGAIALPYLIDDAPQPPQRPCDSCTGTPCVTACPVGALGAGQAYDVPACQAHLATSAGRDCLTNGCLVRRACPVSKAFGRLPEQSEFHMAAFAKD